MKKTLFAGILIALSTGAMAQCEFNAGTKTLYKANATEDKIPEGYSTVFINHVGRHGSRHLTKDLTATGGYQLLKKAEAAGMLTDKGIRLLQFLNDLHKEEQKNLKSISAQGKEEQQRNSRQDVCAISRHLHKECRLQSTDHEGSKDKANCRCIPGRVKEKKRQHIQHCLQSKRYCIALL
jgi:hypothetical protein